MKFVLPAQSTDPNKKLKDFLLHVYSGKAPQYLTLFFPDPSICLAQIHSLCKAIKKHLKKINSPHWHSLSAKVDTLYKNIEEHINNFDTLSDTEKTNTVDFCKIGKRCLENITCSFIQGSQSQQKSFTVMAAFLHEDQIALCMGGVLTIVQEYSLKFTFDIATEITNACMNGIKSSANMFIERFDLLHFTNENGRAIRKPESLKNTHEIHYINNLFNCVATKFTFLNPITDSYTKLFPIGEWHNLFTETLNENDLIAFYLQNIFNSLPELPLNRFDLALYTHCCTLLDEIGSDPAFSLYEDNDGKFQLKNNYRLALYSTIIKRLINSKLLECSEHDLQYEFHIAKTTYILYLFGNPGQYWIECIDKDKVLTFISFKDQVPNELLMALSNSQDSVMREAVLRAAAVYNNIALLDILYISGIDINCEDYEGRTSMMVAAISGSLDFIKILVQSEDVIINAQDNNKKTALMWAVEGFDSAGVIPLLLQHSRIDTEMKDSHNRTALHIAIATGNIDATMELIIDSRVNVNATDNHGYSCLRIAALYNRIEIATNLLRCEDLDINHLAYDGNSTLHAVTSYGLLTFMKLLLKQNNINVNIKSRNRGKTPLMLAIEDFRNDAFKLLLNDNRTNLNMCDVDEKTAQAIAIKCENRDAVRLIRQLLKLKDPIASEAITRETTAEPMVLEPTAQNVSSPKRRARPSCSIM